MNDFLPPGVSHSELCVCVLGSPLPYLSLLLEAGQRSPGNKPPPTLHTENLLCEGDHQQLKTTTGALVVGGKKRPKYGHGQYDAYMTQTGSFIKFSVQEVLWKSLWFCKPVIAWCLLPVSETYIFIFESKPQPKLGCVKSVINSRFSRSVLSLTLTQWRKLGFPVYLCYSLINRTFSQQNQVILCSPSG